MKTSGITPELNSEIVKETEKRCIALNDYSKKTFDKIFNQIIMEHGYSVKYYHAYMRKYF